MAAGATKADECDAVADSNNRDIAGLRWTILYFCSLGRCCSGHLVVVVCALNIVSCERS